MGSSFIPLAGALKKMYIFKQGSHFFLINHIKIVIKTIASRLNLDGSFNFYIYVEKKGNGIWRICIYWAYGDEATRNKHTGEKQYPIGELYPIGTLDVDRVKKLIYPNSAEEGKGVSFELNGTKPKEEEEEEIRRILEGILRPFMEEALERFVAGAKSPSDDPRLSA
ncbi:MAG: hypothetical protein ACOX2O_06350 [Bdellovibrionota bacterium]